MPISEEHLKIINEFLKTASPEELKELDALLKQGGSMLGGRVDVYNFAADMAEQVKRDIGYSRQNIRNTALRLVADLALQYDPDISPGELKSILRQMVPDEPPLYRQIPKEVLAAMVEHFISFSDGSMPRDTAEDFPRGWQKKYWNTFPPSMKRAIAGYIRGEISKDDLWRYIETLFKGKGKK